jgi:hypothetical protein
MQESFGGAVVRCSALPNVKDNRWVSIVVVEVNRPVVEADTAVIELACAVARSMLDRFDKNLAACTARERRKSIEVHGEVEVLVG